MHSKGNSVRHKKRLKKIGISIGKFCFAVFHVRSFRFDNVYILHRSIELKQKKTSDEDNQLSNLCRTEIS